MRLALTEQEETQSQMEEILEDKLHLIQELSDGMKKLVDRLFRYCWNHKCFSSYCSIIQFTKAESINSNETRFSHGHHFNKEQHEDSQPKRFSLS